MLPRIPHRLEHVRELHGIETLKEFHERIGGDDFKSYSAVRNYHHCDHDPKRERVAPADYLARVAKVFGVRLEWLITGERPVTVGQQVTEDALAEEEQRREGLDEEAEKSIQEHRERVGAARTALAEATGASVSPVAFAVFLHAWNRMKSQPEVYFDTEHLSLETFARALMAPLHEAEGEVGAPGFMEIEDYINRNVV